MICYTNLSLDSNKQLIGGITDLLDITFRKIAEYFEILSVLISHKYLKVNLDLTEKGKMLMFLLRNYVFSKEVLL